MHGTKKQRDDDASPNPHHKDGDPTDLAVIVDIIGQDAAVLDSTRLLLEFHGYAVRCFKSAETYLKGVHMPASCLLIDQLLDGTTGLELLRRLRAQRNLTPAILLMDRADPLPSADEAPLEFTHLDKPAFVEDLIAAIEDACRKGLAMHRAGREST